MEESVFYNIAIYSLIILVLLGGGAGVMIFLYKMLRKVGGDNADMELSPFARKKVYCPSDSTLTNWGAQISRNENMFDPAESNLFTILLQIVMGSISLRYGDRFRLLFKVPARSIFAACPGKAVRDTDLVRITNRLTADFVIAVDNGAHSPAAIFLLWDGYPQALNGRMVARSCEINRRWLYSENQIRRWTLAELAAKVGIPAFYVNCLAVSDPEFLGTLKRELEDAVDSSHLALG